DRERLTVQRARGTSRPRLGFHRPHQGCELRITNAELGTEAGRRERNPGSGEALQPDRTQLHVEQLALTRPLQGRNLVVTGPDGDAAVPRHEVMVLEARSIVDLDRPRGDHDYPGRQPEEAARVAAEHRVPLQQEAGPLGLCAGEQGLAVGWADLAVD